MERVGQHDSNCVQVFLLEKQMYSRCTENAKFFRNLYIVITETSK